MSSRWLSTGASVAGLMGFAIHLVTLAQPPQILQIHREALRPGVDAAYRQVEEDAARICATLGCPHPYLGIESLTGTKEAWFLNGFASPAEQKQVVDDYARNPPLLAALERNGKRKALLTFEPVNIFARYREELSGGAPWAVGQGRFLTIIVTRSSRRITGTVFEADDGTRFVVLPAHTRQQAAAAAATAGPESNVFAVRPSWSLPAEEWIAADAIFWRPSTAPKRQ